MKVTLFGAESDDLRPIFEQYNALKLVDEDPDAIVCYGGDGTLLSAEQSWPGVTKVPIRNSVRGNRMMARPAEAVVRRLAEGRLVPTEFLKLQCTLMMRSAEDTLTLHAMNEFNVQHTRTNAAVRYKLCIDGELFENTPELIGDGFVVSTPFGSTAYYRQITRGVFYTGLGVAFKYAGELTNHVVIPDDSVIEVEITRGPAMFAYDNWPQFITVDAGTRIVIKKNPQPATVLTWEPMKWPSDSF